MSVVHRVGTWEFVTPANLSMYCVNPTSLWASERPLGGDAICIILSSSFDSLGVHIPPVISQATQQIAVRYLKEFQSLVAATSTALSPAHRRANVTWRLPTSQKSEARFNVTKWEGSYLGSRLLSFSKLPWLYNWVFHLAVFDSIFQSPVQASSQHLHCLLASEWDCRLHCFVHLQLCVPDLENPSDEGDVRVNWVELCLLAS